MKTTAATIALTIMFLSAGAFAGNSRTPAMTANSSSTNVTVVEKNQSWPIASVFVASK